MAGSIIPLHPCSALCFLREAAAPCLFVWVGRARFLFPNKGDPQHSLTLSVLVLGQCDAYTGLGALTKLPMLYSISFSFAHVLCASVALCEYTDLAV